jgi:ubiquinone biosynthesis protein
VDASERALAAGAVARRIAPGRRPWRSLGLEPGVLLSAWVLRALAGRLALALAAPLAAPPVRRARREAWAQRSLTALVAVLGALKGPFVKAAQFASHRHDLVPAGASRALAQLRDRVPPLPFRRIRAAVEAELGAPLGARFSRFDAEPLGAASVAQVHRARLVTGEEVAVKVQYPWLEDALPADLLWVRTLLAAGSRALGGARIDVRRLCGEFEAGLREELDFRREAFLAAEIAANLADDPQIVVPRVIASHSTRRVLTMSFHPAVPVTDRVALARMGVEPRAVLEVVARAYAKQVFVDGLFHADPHPGNLFVLDEAGAAGRPRVLFVDFGLSRRLDDGLRREMRLGMYALLQRDLGAFVDGMTRMGMVAPGAETGVRHAVKHMFERLGREGGALTVSGSKVLALKDEAVLLLRETQGLQLPNDLLLFARTLSYVFGLGQELDPDTDLMQLSLPYLVRFLAGSQEGQASAQRAGGERRPPASR